VRLGRAATAAAINDTWRDHSPRTGYPVTAVVRRGRVAPVRPGVRQPRHRVLARIAADAGAVVCFAGAGALVLGWAFSLV
jgi:hypothetical protein